MIPPAYALAHARRPRITLSMLGVACVPLALAGWNGIRLADEALRRRTGDLHETVARLLADTVGDSVRSRLHGLRLAAAAVRFNELRDDEKLGALRLVFRQVEDMTVLVLLNARGEQVARPVYLGDRHPTRCWRTGRRWPRETWTSSLRTFRLRRLPRSARPSVSPTSPRRENRVLASRSGLTLTTFLQQNSPSTDRPPLSLSRDWVREDGRLSPMPRVMSSSIRIDKPWPGGTTAATGSLSELYWPTARRPKLLIPGVGAAIGAGARISDIGWAVVVAEPVEDALAASRTLLWRTLLWLGAAVLAAGVLGVASTRAIMRPLRSLHGGATSLERGELGHRVRGVDRVDELGNLARAFNKMADEVERWNRELEARVNDKTRELKEAQDLLLRAQTARAEREVKTVCPYCGVGCSMYLGVKDGKIVGVRGDEQGPVNQGRLCVKGRFGIAEFVNHTDRLTTPLIRKNNRLVEASWDEALSLVAGKLGNYRGDEVAVISSAKSTNEDNYVMQKFARAVLGTNNVDHCARL